MAKPAATSSSPFSTSAALLPAGYYNRGLVGAMQFPSAHFAAQYTQANRANVPTFPATLPAPPRLQPIPSKHLSRHSNNNQ